MMSSNFLQELINSGIVFINLSNQDFKSGTKDGVYATAYNKTKVLQDVWDWKNKVLNYISNFTDFKKTLEYEKSEFKYSEKLTENEFYDRYGNQVLLKQLCKPMIQFLEQEISRNTLPPAQKITMVESVTSKHKRKIETQWFSNIKTEDDLLRNRRVFNILKNEVMRLSEIPEKKFQHKFSTQDIEILEMLINLGIAKYDLVELDKMTGNNFNKIIDAQIDGVKLNHLLNRVNGKGSVLKRDILEYFTEDVGSRLKEEQLQEIFNSFGLPDKMLEVDAKNDCGYVFSYLTSSKNTKDLNTFLQILNLSLHPIYFKADKIEAKKKRDKYITMLEYANLKLINIPENKLNGLEKPMVADSNKITNITFVRNGNRKTDKTYLIILNNDYTRTYEIKNVSKSIRILETFENKKQIPSS
jgi:hypothetical protein